MVVDDSWWSNESVFCLIGTLWFNFYFPFVFVCLFIFVLFCFCFFVFVVVVVCFCCCCFLYDTCMMMGIKERKIKIEPRIKS